VGAGSAGRGPDGGLPAPGRLAGRIPETPNAGWVVPAGSGDSDIIDSGVAVFGDLINKAFHAGIEGDALAAAYVACFASFAYLQKRDTFEECRTAHGGATPIVSKIRQIVSKEHDKIRRRLVLDSEQSDITLCARMNQRVVGPVVTDLILDALRTTSAGSVAERMVLDVTDAFWTVGLLEDERAYIVGELRVTSTSPSWRPTPSLRPTTPYCR